MTHWPSSQHAKSAPVRRNYDRPTALKNDFFLKIDNSFDYIIKMIYEIFDKFERFIGWLIQSDNKLNDLLFDL